MLASFLKNIVRIPYFSSEFCENRFLGVHRLAWLHQVRSMVDVATWWLGLTPTHFACIAATREKDRILVLGSARHCKFCNILTSDQLAQLSTPSYKLKKDKQEAKSTSTPSKEPASDTLSPTLVDSARVGSGGCGWPGLRFECTTC